MIDLDREFANTRIETRTQGLGLLCVAAIPKVTLRTVEGFERL